VTVLAVFAGLQQALVGYLVLERRQASRDFIALVDRLCQRLQAPGAAEIGPDATVRTRRPPEYAPPALEPEDDEGYWMSREKLAELAMQAEVDERTT
jgi:hypothetical protein